MRKSLKFRRLLAVGAILILLTTGIALHPEFNRPHMPQSTSQGDGSALSALNGLAVKGRAPKTGYERAQFGDGWGDIQGCDTRNVILHRDLENATVNERCQVTSGTLNDPYTGKMIQFTRGADTSDDVQI